MTTGRQLATSALAAVVIVATLGARANAAQCGNGPGAFESWNQQFAPEAGPKGTGSPRTAALIQANTPSAPHLPLSPALRR